MQIQELIDELIAPAGGRLEKTVDTVKAGDSSPVSYTHLDVYKRQGFHGGDTGADIVI